MLRPASRCLQGCPVRSAVLRGFTTFYRRKTWRPELEPARVAEFPQPAHKTRAPNTEQFTACTLRIAGWIKKYNEARPHQGRWRQNPDADLRGCNADDEGENDRGLTATDTKT